MIDAELEQYLRRLESKIDQIIPEVKDVSKYLAEAKELANKGKPPRKQPKKKGRTIDPNFIAGEVSTDASKEKGSWAESMAKGGRK